MVHGFHLLELWNRHSADHSMEYLGIQSNKFATGNKNSSILKKIV